MTHVDRPFIATVAEAAKQKDISEGIQLDATEMVRRAERALGVAIRDGQAPGEIERRGARSFRGNQYSRGEDHDTEITSPRDFLGDNATATDTYAMTDSVSDVQFDARAHGVETGRIVGNGCAS